MPQPINTIEVEEGMQEVTTSERRNFSILSTNGTPTSVSSVTVYNSAGTDVTSTIIPSGAASISGDAIVLPTLRAFTVGQIYRVRVVYVTSEQPMIEVMLRLNCVQ